MPDMLVKLYELPELAPVIAPLKEKGIEIRRGLPPEKHIVADWVQEHFNSHWKSECEAAFSRLPVSCLVAVQADPETGANKVIGFACYNSTAKGFFGPTGVAVETRGLGVGKALLLAAFHAMKEEGYGYGIIGGAGPMEFYTKMVGAIEIPDSKPGIYRGMLK